MNIEETKKTSFWKSKKFLYSIGFIFLLGFINSLSDNDKQPIQTLSDKTVAVTEKKEIPKVDTVAKEKAQKELDEFMTMAKKADLITSYDFSKLNDTVYRWDMYAGKTWYIQTVQQKKDFIAYVSIRKKIITGYSHLKLLDGYTNEKIAEMTSFSSSIEIYK